ncbi:MAG TPA: hypothetical protein VM841_01675 [Actinomycetota bacterium]|nr:hypothetical protein [Actinomycetota bacterium]
MRLRRIVAAAAVAAVALMPGSGHALGEVKRNVPGSICTVGDASLAYNAVSGTWTADSNLTCHDGTASVNHPILAYELTLAHVQGVDVSLTGATLKRVPVAASGRLGCEDCWRIQGQAKRTSLVQGVYVVITQGWVTQTEGGLRYGTHETCFVVMGNNAGPATAIPGCTL